MSLLARLVFLLAATTSAASQAATFGELSGSADAEAYGPYAAGPYSAYPSGPCPCPPPASAERAYAGPAVWPYAAPGPYGGYQALAPGSPLLARGQEGAPPPALDAPGFGPPYPPPAYPAGGGVGSAPNAPLQSATFQQINSTTDPYNAWGLSTPFMFVPWSTPLSGWTNAQTWNWWRQRSGASPYGW